MLRRWATGMRPFSSAARAAATPSVRVFPNFIRVLFGDGSNAPADFHHRWLRHQCTKDRHPQTGEQQLNPVWIPAEIGPVRVRMVAPTQQQPAHALEVEWNDGRLSQYSLSFLQQHQYGSSPLASDRSDNLRAMTRDERNCTFEWGPNANNADATSGDGATATSTPGKRFKNPAAFAATLERLGLVVIKGGPRHPLDSLWLVRHIFGGQLIETHFGLVEDLRVSNSTNKNNDQLGYTSSAVELHTDQVFIDSPPTMQMLHCIQPAESGGESQFADGFAVADHMRENHPLHFHLLSTIPVNFHRRQAKFESLHVSPIIRVDPATQRVEQVRLSYFTMDPFKVPFHLMESFYDAYKLFAELLKSPVFCYAFNLQPGDLAVYNNYRMTHARTAFTGTKRHLRGMQFVNFDCCLFADILFAGIYMELPRVMAYLRDARTDYGALPYAELREPPAAH